MPVVRAVGGLYEHHDTDTAHTQAHRRPTEQNLFGIVQGGLDTSPGGLREVID